jgi:hypothetical protein
VLLARGSHGLLGHLLLESSLHSLSRNFIILFRVNIPNGSGLEVISVTFCGEWPRYLITLVVTLARTYTVIRRMTGMDIVDGEALEVCRRSGVSVGLGNMLTHLFGRLKDYHTFT